MTFKTLSSEELAVLDVFQLGLRKAADMYLGDDVGVFITRIDIRSDSPSGLIECRGLVSFAGQEARFSFSIKAGAVEEALGPSSSSELEHRELTLRDIQLVLIESQVQGLINTISFFRRTPVGAWRMSDISWVDAIPVFETMKQQIA